MDNDLGGVRTMTYLVASNHLQILPTARTRGDTKEDEEVHWYKLTHQPSLAQKQEEGGE